MRISVVVPVHNEQENIGPLIDEIFQVMQAQSYQFEVIYVDDGSTDGTLDLLQEQKKIRGDFLRVIRHEQACGQSTAIYTGIHAARHEWVVTLDGDGQNDPADIPALLETVAQKQENPHRFLAAGYRHKRHDSWIRRASSRIANAFRSWLLKDRTPDTGCGLKAFSRELFLELPYFDHMHRFLPALVLRIGGEVQSVPVSHRPRKQGRSKYGIHNRLWVGIVDLFGVSWLQRRERRPKHVVEEKS
ncbi:MAG: glycosyltransferase family 2 protein [Gammaproteobacteria bacterium]|nr:glycosyltransferase family 2 protein [Gammaproteobacteria bacterium]